jgi:hypothetical protein
MGPQSLSPRPHKPVISAVNACHTGRLILSSRPPYFVIPTALLCHPDRSGGISTSWQEALHLALLGAASRRSFGCAQDEKI